MRKYVTIPILQLVSDVATDPVHVRELADSIKVSGPISPVLVREETSELIDGFHRVAAMRELGFDSVECILSPCDDEVFWDLRIMSATLHKAVTFARAVDWLEEVFSCSPWKDRYASAHSLFHQASTREAPKEAQEWVQTKVKKWGLSVKTIEHWLQAKESMAPELQASVKEGRLAEGVSPDHYIEVARRLPSRPELQKRVIEKSQHEGLSSKELREVAKAVRGAADEEEVKTILSEPVARTADQLTRAAKVEKLLREPLATPAPAERRQELTGLALEVYLDLQQQVHNVKRLRSEALETLTPSQKDELLRAVDDLMAELQRVADTLRGVMEGKLIEGG